MSRLLMLVPCLLLLVTLDGSAAHAGARQGTAGNPRSSRPNTWSARSSTGLTLAGTWTAVANETTGAVTGTWALLDAQGRTAARGGWSASKAPAGWTGNWRAAASGGRAEYAGTWSAGVDLKADAPLADLFAKAAQTIVSGTWRVGRQSGSWSIQAFK